MALTRVTVGSIFVIDGVGKLLQLGLWQSGIDAVALYLWTFGTPFPMALSWGVSLIEAVGGVLLIGGLFTRYAAGALAFAFAVPAVFIHGPGGYPWGSMGPIYANGDLTVMLIIVSVVIALLGPGRLSLDVRAPRPGPSSVRIDEVGSRPAEPIPRSH